MELSKRDSKILQGIAILFMLLLHLFCRKDINGLYDTFPTINGTPLVYYIGLFGDACVPIYLFVSGYGLFISAKKLEQGKNKLFKRIFKLIVNYWIILLLFVSIGFFAGRADMYPGSVGKFILHFFVLSSSYNGAWWFLQTYIILVLLSPFLFKLVKKYHSIPILLLSGVIYVISYIQRFKFVLDFHDIPVLDIFMNSIVLVGTSQLAFIVGAIFAKEKIFTKIYNEFSNFPYKNLLSIFGIFMLVVLHSFFESVFFAPFTAIAFICFFHLINKGVFIDKTFTYFGNHSTNIWLTHMFFYMTIFPNLTFAPKYPILIFMWLIILSLCSSYVINAIYKPILRIIDKNNKITSVKYDNKLAG